MASLVIILASCLYALSMYASSKALIATIDTAIEKEYRCNISIERISFGIPPEVTFHNVTLATNQGSQIAVVLHCKKVRVSIDLLKAITSIKEFQSFFFPVAQTKPIKKTQPSTTCQLIRLFVKTPFLDVIKRTTLLDGDLAISINGDPVVAVNDLLIDCGFITSGGTMITGSIVAKNARIYDQWNTGRIKAHVAIDSSLLKITDFSTATYQGSINATGSLDLKKEFLNPTHIIMRDIDCGLAYNDMKAHPGSLAGTLSGTLDLGPCALTPESFTGTGNTTITTVKISDLPVQKSLFLALVLPQIATLSFSTIKTDLRLSYDKIENIKTEGTGNPISFVTNGWISPFGNLSQRTTILFSKYFCASMPAFVRNSLDPAKDDQKSISATIKGTTNDPQVKLDQELVNRAVNNAMGEMIKGIRDYFRK